MISIVTTILLLYSNSTLFYKLTYQKVIWVGVTTHDPITQAQLRSSLALDSNSHPWVKEGNDVFLPVALLTQRLNSTNC